MPPPVTLIAVTYNSAAVLPDFLAALPADAPLIVSDNASRDDTLAIARRLRPEAAILAHAENLGYGTAANRALAQVRTPFALLLNPDTFLTPATLPALLTAANAWPLHGIFGCQLVDVNRRAAVSAKPPLFSPGHRLFKPVLRLGRRPPPAAQGPLPVEKGWICGAAMFFRMAVLREKIGYFDENIFLYFEETDLCLRAVRAGVPPLLVPQAVAVHWGGRSSDDPQADARKHYHLERSRYYLARKYPADVPAVIPAIYGWYYRLKRRLHAAMGNVRQTNLYQARAEAAREAGSKQQRA